MWGYCCCSSLILLLIMRLFCGAALNIALDLKKSLGYIYDLIHYKNDDKQMSGIVTAIASQLEDAYRQALYEITMM